MRIRWFQRASLDTAQIQAYIAETDPGSAAVVADRILTAVERLISFPHLGRLGQVEGTRELVVSRTPYLVVYRVNSDVIEILRVLHGAQRWPDS